MDILEEEDRPGGRAEYNDRKQPAAVVYATINTILKNARTNAPAHARGRTELRKTNPGAASGGGVHNISGSYRLSVTDSKSGLHFLVDTGANVSVCPPNKKANMSECDDYKLYAANGSVIKTYGTMSYLLDFNLHRKFRWNFIVADVKQPILGADFF